LTLSGGDRFARASYKQTPVGNLPVSTEDVDCCYTRCKVLLLESIKPFEKWEQAVVLETTRKMKKPKKVKKAKKAGYGKKAKKAKKAKKK
jgi:hypothetical protein